MKPRNIKLYVSYSVMAFTIGAFSLLPLGCSKNGNPTIVYQKEPELASSKDLNHEVVDTISQGYSAEQLAYDNISTAMFELLWAEKKQNDPDFTDNPWYKRSVYREADGILSPLLQSELGIIQNIYLPSFKEYETGGWRILKNEIINNIESNNNYVYRPFLGWDDNFNRIYGEWSTKKDDFLIHQLGYYWEVVNNSYLIYWDDSKDYQLQPVENSIQENKK